VTDNIGTCRECLTRVKGLRNIRLRKHLTENSWGDVALLARQDGTKDALSVSYGRVLESRVNASLPGALLRIDLVNDLLKVERSVLIFKLDFGARDGGGKGGDESSSEFHFAIFFL
jgi:hypothetical protein